MPGVGRAHWTACGPPGCQNCIARLILPFFDHYTAMHTTFTVSLGNARLLACSMGPQAERIWCRPPLPPATPQCRPTHSEKAALTCKQGTTGPVPCTYTVFPPLGLPFVAAPPGTTMAAQSVPGVSVASNPSEAHTRAQPLIPGMSRYYNEIGTMAESTSAFSLLA